VNLLSQNAGFREEVVNVKLAEALSKRKIMSVPEMILKSPNRRRLPDVISATYLGMLVIIEGKIEDSAGVRGILETDCRKRIEEGIGSIIIGLLYPQNIRSIMDLESLEKFLDETEFNIKIFTEEGEGDWFIVTINTLTGILGQVYERLVKEDTVNKAVDSLQSAIENALPLLSIDSATEERLREILVVPKSE